MVHIQVDDPGTVSLLQADGDCITVAAQICAAIGSLYQNISTTHSEAGEMFKETIEILLKRDGEAWRVKSTGPPESGGCMIISPPM